MTIDFDPFWRYLHDSIRKKREKLTITVSDGTRRDLFIPENNKELGGFALCTVDFPSTLKKTVHPYQVSFLSVSIKTAVFNGKTGFSSSDPEKFSVYTLKHPFSQIEETKDSYFPVSFQKIIWVGKASFSWLWYLTVCIQRYLKGFRKWEKKSKPDKDCGETKSSKVWFGMKKKDSSSPCCCLEVSFKGKL
jgi:hypothetical protein